MTARAHHRAATWLNLLVAVLLAVVPTGGLAMCLDDGHMEVGTAGCPCDHTDGAGFAGETSDAQPGHPPCEDLVVEGLRFLRDDRSSGPGDDDERGFGDIVAQSTVAVTPAALESFEPTGPPVVPRFTNRELRTVLLLI